MKNMIRIAAVSLLCLAAGLAYGAVPVMNVTVSDTSGKAAFKGTTNGSGGFATAKLKAGNYTVQLSSKNAVKGSHYAIVLSAGKKKVSAGAVPAEKLAGGGVALKVDVADGLNITGQVAAESNGAVKDGKKMVWIPPQAGSHFPGHWAEEGSPEAVAAKTAGNLSTSDVQRMQDKNSNPQGN